MLAQPLVIIKCQIKGTFLELEIGASGEKLINSLTFQIKSLYFWLQNFNNNALDFFCKCRFVTWFKIFKTKNESLFCSNSFQRIIFLGVHYLPLIIQGSKGIRQYMNDKLTYISNDDKQTYTAIDLASGTDLYIVQMYQQITTFLPFPMSFFIC